jgi:hypothetical protein
MSAILTNAFYESHSFDQRVIPYGNGFALASHGDCYDRAFTTAYTDGNTVSSEVARFHFYVDQGTFDAYNMSVLNKTFAKLGGLAQTSNGLALVGASAKSLNAAAKTESQNVFVQIFNPQESSTYVTSGTRSGTGGNTGETNVTDHGVKWLTNYTSETVKNPQVVAIDGDKLVVLWELYDASGKFQSTYYSLLDASGEILKSEVSIGNVYLDTDEDPVFANGSVYWVGNSLDQNEMVVNQLTIK